MHLKRLEIHGFKSFAQRTVLEFEPGITAIVGPNGSGKSNVSDAVRWVLGEQSAKQLRGKKSDDVVFAGSDKRSRGSVAEVVATFDNSDRKIPVDAPEVSIGRRVDRSGESEYLINGSRVRLLDIIDLVLKSNIGTSRYTVIGQGTIDQLILAGPTEIKGLLDEASGVKTYHVRREKTLKRLEQTAQNLMRAEDVVRELEPRLKSLRRQAKRMEAREGLELELSVFQRERLGGLYFGFMAEIQTLQQQIENATGRREREEQQLGAIRKRMELMSQESLGDVTAVATLRRDMLSLQEQKNRLLEQRSILQGKLASAKSGEAGDPRTLQVQAAQIAAKVAALNTQLEEAQRVLEACVSQSRLADAERLSVEQKLEELYKVLSEPTTPDTAAYERIVEELHGAVQAFLATLEQAGELAEMHHALAAFRNTYASLRKGAQEFSIGNRAGVGVDTQQELKQLHEAKSVLEKQLSQLSVRRAGAETSTRLLEEQRQSLLQEQLDVRLELQKASSGGSDSFVHDLTAEATAIEQQVTALQADIRSQEERLAQFDGREVDRRRFVTEAEREMRSIQDRIDQVRTEEARLAVEKARVDTQQEAVITEIQQVFGVETAREVLQIRPAMQTSDLEDKIAKLKHQLDLIGGVDEMTMQEYRETEERFTRLSEQIADLTRSMEDLREIMDELDEHIKTRFNEAFHRINERFESYFRILFNGGRAQLALVRASDEKLGEGEEVGSSDDRVITEQLRPEEKIVQKYESGGTNVTGVDMKATPPGKKLANIQALSGGERALTSIALLCALLACFPSPFVVLDEVDAALDEANTIRFGQILGTLSHQTQFVTISHNRETMAQSKMLYGVTMGDDGVSKILSLKFDQATAYAK
ncbi:MAG: AAA family ATPase [Candidatus Doudnabacteria bacterium]|nr:AAA family ATPase [Candidatus Doudnabacteria bacterium]